MRSISIIIPYHRNIQMLLTSLKTLEESLNDCFHTEVIIVANNLSKKELQIDINNKRYKVLKYNQNLFYPEAIKKGVQASTGDFLVFADPDVFFCEKWLEQMIICYDKHEAAGCVGAKLINPYNNRIIDFGIGYHNYHTLHAFRGIPYNHKLCSYDINVQSVCSALFLIDHTFFESLGGFDNEMPYAYCDNDLCLRIREKGYNVWVAANACAYHKGNTDNQNSKYYAFKYLKEDCAAAFFYKNNNRYNNDYDQYLLKSLNYYDASFFNKEFIFINLSTAYDWKSYMQILMCNGIKIIDKKEYVVSERNTKLLDLTNLIDMNLISKKVL